MYIGEAQSPGIGLNQITRRILFNQSLSEEPTNEESNRGGDITGKNCIEHSKDWTKDKASGQREN